MKNVIAILLTLSVIGCQLSTQRNTPIPSLAKKEKKNKKPSRGSAPFTIQFDGEILGELLGWEYNFASIHTKDDFYMQINLETGKHRPVPMNDLERIYFENCDCTGDAVILYWQGEVGKTVIQSKLGDFYIVDSATDYTPSDSFEYRSKLHPYLNGCYKFHGQVGQYAGNLIEIDSPLEFPEGMEVIYE